MPPKRKVLTTLILPRLSLARSTDRRRATNGAMTSLPSPENVGDASALHFLASHGHLLGFVVLCGVIIPGMFVFNPVSVCLVSCVFDSGRPLLADTLIELDSDSDDDEDMLARLDAVKAGAGAGGHTEEYAPCTLPPTVQKLLSMLFDDATSMHAMQNLDIDIKKVKLVVLPFLFFPFSMSCSAY